MSQAELRIIMSGGGTGGHVFPAIAIANAIMKLEPTANIKFVGALGKMEMEKVPAVGYTIEGLWISGLKRNLTMDNLSFPLKLASSLWKSRQIINRFKPQVVVGTGGFASGPLLYMASQMGIPTIIQEQNSYPGITNKLLAKRAAKICVAYNGMERYFPQDKLFLTGNPVREDVLNIQDKRIEAIQAFGLNPDKKTLLVVGGSLGALSINESILAGVDQLNDAGIQVLWQTGTLFYPRAKALLDEKGCNTIKAVDFITRMDLGYAVADAVISRAGASALSELALVKKAAVLVPLPSAAEDHQTKNAMALVENKAAILVKNSDAKQMLVTTALELLQNEVLLSSMQQNISKMAHYDAAETIAREVIKLAEQDKK